MVKAKKRSRGFTLIELLVAIGILAIVAVLGWRGLDSIIRARVSLNDDLEQTRGLQLAFAQMQTDCENIADANNIGGRNIISSQAGVVALTRMVYSENQPSRIQVVTYRLRNGVLTRSETAPTRDLTALDAAWSAALSDANNTPSVTLKSGVAALNVRSWVTNGTAWRIGTDPVSSTTNATNTNTGQTSQTGTQTTGIGQTTSGTGTSTTGTTGTTGTPVPASNTATPLTGLEVSVTLQGREGTLQKVFLLGAT